MTLDDWMLANNVSNCEMARRCKRSTSTISRVRRGLEHARPDLVRRIIALTDGQVTPNDLYSEPKKPKRRKKAA